MRDKEAEKIQRPTPLQDLDLKVIFFCWRYIW